MDIVCTLFEKHYDYGVGVLSNSLAKNGFKGKIVVGYKGRQPFWINQLQQTGQNEYQIYNDINILFICLDHISYHLGYYKSSFILHCLKEFPETETISYFDPDITVQAKWSFFKKWINAGVALATDNCYPFLHLNHPWRTDWKALFPKKNIISFPECYLNSGFIGIKKSDREVVELWHDALNSYISAGGNIHAFERNAESGLKGDQDLLNAALMYFPYDRLSIIGQEAMGFIQPSYIMGHAIGGTKPWRRNFIIDLIKKNISPSYAEKLYFTNCLSPIRIFSTTTYKLKLIDLKIASVLNRFL